MSKMGYAPYYAPSLMIVVRWIFPLSILRIGSDSPTPIYEGLAVREKIMLSIKRTSPSSAATEDEKLWLLRVFHHVDEHVGIVLD